MIVRINERNKLKQDLQACLSKEVCLGEALLRLGGQESVETLGSGSPRRRDLRLGGAPRLGVEVSERRHDQIWPFLLEISFQTKTNSIKIYTVISTRRKM